MSTSGLRVRFYVEYGPARVISGRLMISEVPRYARRPIKVKVVAYQWGRMAGVGGQLAVQTANPVTRTLFVIPRTPARMAQTKRIK